MQQDIDQQEDFSAWVSCFLASFGTRYSAQHDQTHKSRWLMLGHAGIDNITDQRCKWLKQM